ncbi:hypothetical protein [Pedobacter gandavensis]|uniref:hypothetical protein n=1 Tax=Pedobacter gandavensis TaxID=2679963 RepID=UPI00292FC784|nr:hypothetical protein [Pedobacter gandavensis]
MSWYAFIGTDCLNPTHYRIKKNTPRCTGSKSLCAIFSTGNTYPEIDYELVCHIVLALSSKTSNEKVVLKN